MTYEELAEAIGRMPEKVRKTQAVAFLSTKEHGKVRHLHTTRIAFHLGEILLPDYPTPNWQER